MAEGGNTRKTIRFHMKDGNGLSQIYTLRGVTELQIFDLYQDGMELPREFIVVPYNACLDKLKPYEPFFTLLGRDAQAPEVINHWASSRAAAEGEADKQKVNNARHIANGMQAYRNRMVQDELKEKVGKAANDPDLAKLIERARSYKMSEQEAHEQRRSFTRGMCPSHIDYQDWCRTVDKVLPPWRETTRRIEPQINDEE